MPVCIAVDSTCYDSCSSLVRYRPDLAYVLVLYYCITANYAIFSLYVGKYGTFVCATLFPAIKLIELYF
jgi:hypothetical protein